MSKKKADWQTGLQKNKQGLYLASLRNAALILTHSDEWRNVLAFDAFGGVIVKQKAPPWPEDIAPEENKLGDWTREDSIRSVCWFSDEWNISFPTFVVEEAVQVVAARWQVHPVRDYLNGLKWDGKKRLDDLLIRHAGAVDNIYVRAVTKSFFLASVARTFQPGCKVDTVLILEGAQGAGKSTLLEVLASKLWFLDTVITPGTKDGYQALRRKWIIEWGELDTLQRAELSRVKAFISSVKDSYRPSYGRSTIDFFRQCVFAGTVNPDGGGYLVDPTGARRFWPVTVSNVDLTAVRTERDQLWAEAVARYRKCESWHLDDSKLRRAAAAEAEDRRIEHPWETYAARWLADYTKRFDKGVTTVELLEKAVGMPSDRQTRADQVTMGHALRAIGWTVVRRGTDGCRRYFPGPSCSKPDQDEGHNLQTSNRKRDLKTPCKKKRGKK